MNYFLIFLTHFKLKEKYDKLRINIKEGLGGKLTKRKSCLLKPKFISCLDIGLHVAGEAFMDQQKKIMKGSAADSISR